MTKRREFELAAVLTLKDRLTGPIRRIASRINTHFAVPMAHAKIAVNQLASASNALANGAMAATAIATAAATAALLDYAHAADFTIKSSRKVGLSSEQWSRLTHAASLSGVAVTEFTEIMSKAPLQLEKLQRKTGPLYELLRRTSPAMLKSIQKSAKTSEDLLLMVADAYVRIEDPAQKAALASAAFGEMGLKMASLLSGGSQAIRAMGDDAESLGIVITEKAGQAAEQFNDDLDRLKLSAKGVVGAIGRELIPTLTPLIQKMTAWIKANRELIATKVEEFIKSVGAWLQSIDWDKTITSVQNFAFEVGELIGKLGGLDGIIAIVKGSLVLKLASSLIGLIAPVVTLTYHIGAFAVTLSVQLIKALVQAGAAMLTFVASAIMPMITTATTMLMPAITAIGTAFMGLATTIGLSMKIIAGVTGIGLLIALAGWAIADWENFKKFFSGLVDWMVDAAKWLVSPLVDAFNWLWDIVGPIIDGIKSGFAAAVTGLQAVGILDSPSAGPMSEADKAQAANIAKSFGFLRESKIEVVARFENAPPGLRVDRPTAEGAPATGKVQVQTNMGRRTLATGGAL